jgi:hypothetical protein
MYAGVNTSGAVANNWHPIQRSSCVRTGDSEPLTGIEKETLNTAMLEKIIFSKSTFSAEEIFRSGLEM